ncbi:MAG: histidinol-phosphatase HisJ family protein [Phycisphaerae bacterium]
MKLFDYHIHTVRCKHAEGTMDQYVQAAIAAGLGEMGFSDHLPLPMPGPSPWNMLEHELPLYVREVLTLREKYPRIAIRLGAEMDYVEGCEDELRRLARSQAFDYMIGSVHFIPPGSISREPLEPPFLFCVDAPSQLDEWKRHKVDDVYRAHIGQLERLAGSRLCQVIGHVDLPKKFGFRHSSRLLEDYRRLATTIARHGLLCEINTAGLRKPVKEIYPSLDILRILHAAGVGITLGSDAHKPDEVGKDLTLALDLARAAGYDRIHKWAAPGKFIAVGLAGP